MAFIDWSDEFTVGRPDLDSDHQGLVDSINELYEQLQSRKSGVTVVDFLEGVYKAVQEHFVREEQMMIDDAYPGYEAHKADHERSLSSIVKLINKHRDGVPTDETELVRWFRSWFHNHVHDQDAWLSMLFVTDADR